jgi:hypothetical protein
VIFAEILDRWGQVHHRMRIEQFPCVLGRSYTCDLILDDPHVSPHHLQIERDASGQVMVRDLGSTNGTYDQATGRFISAAPLERELRLRVGRTVLRLRSERYMVAPALPVVARTWPWRWLTGHWSAVPVLGGLLALAGGLQGYRGAYTELQLGELVGKQLLGLLLVGLWAGGWALVGRLLTQRARFAAHWSVACLVLLADAGAQELLGIAQFLVPSIAAVELASFAGRGTLLCASLFAHLSLLGAIQLPIRALAATAISLTVAVASALTQQRERDWVAVLPYWSTLRPLTVEWLPRRSPEAFFAAARALQADLDRLAEEEEARGEDARGEDARGEEEAE